MTATPDTSRTTDREGYFLGVVEANRQLISRVCYMYATDSDHFNDLYQEIMANLWQGLDKFRGESKISTWIYRMCLNTCVTYFRRHKRHDAENVALDSLVEVPGDDGTRLAQLREMYRMIASLRPMEKALILMWLDERPYEEIAEVTGLSRNTVATRLRRIKQKLTKQGHE